MILRFESFQYKIIADQSRDHLKMASVKIKVRTTIKLDYLVLLEFILHLPSYIIIQTRANLDAALGTQAVQTHCSKLITVLKYRSLMARSNCILNSLYLRPNIAIKSSLIATFLNNDMQRHEI